MLINELKFPSGRSVANCKKDANRLKKIQNIPLHEALNVVAKDNGLSMPFHKAVALIKNSSSQIMTRGDIQAVLDKHLELTHFGIGLYRQYTAEFNVKKYRATFEKERQSLLDAVDECNRACRYLAHMNKRKTINSFSSSYGLKHRVEEFIERMGDETPYIANGAFICAAIHMGFNYKQGSYGSPNVFFNMSVRSPVWQWKELKDIATQAMLATKGKYNKLELLEKELGFPDPFTSPLRNQ